MLEALDALNQIWSVDLQAWSGVSIVLALFFGTFVSEDAACVAAGTLAASGEISIALAVGSCFAGIVAGDFGLYAVGRILGPRVFGIKLVRRRVSEASLTRASEWLEQRGASAIFLSRFVTGLRLPTYLAAGFLCTSFRKFAVYFILAAGLWTPLVVGSVAIFGEFFSVGAVLLSIGLLVALRYGIKLSKWKNRRMLVGKIRRLTNWEFWPLAVFYFPVVCYVLWLSIRHRSLTAFTSANPAIPAGGFVGESKNDIYKLIARERENRKYVLRHIVLESSLPIDARLEIVDRFIDRNAISFPVVIKPDVGERGKGIKILESRADLEAALHSIDRDHILQEFFDGSEVSIFYYRHPGSEQGHIFSMTEKIFPRVMGDGSSSLEELILRDRRGVCLAEKYFEENRPRLAAVPAAGELVPLIRIGTHSRGAIFRDGLYLKTLDLEHVIDQICRRIDGFYFGRFDIRYSSSDDLRVGRFKIIELNGVTSESTNIYDPRYSLVAAYRILFRQWRIAFEIGLENVSRGVQSTSFFALIESAVRR